MSALRAARALGLKQLEASVEARKAIAQAKAALDRAGR